MPTNKENLLELIQKLLEGRPDLKDQSAARRNAPGRRPILDHKPVPWVGGDYPAKGEWAAIKSDRASEAAEDRLCIICGLELTDDYVYSNFDGETHDEADRRYDARDLNEEFMMSVGMIPEKVKGSPTATFVHPRCALQAAAFCPHLKKQEFPAIAKDGTMLTLADLRKLANSHAK